MREPIDCAAEELEVAGLSVDGVEAAHGFRVVVRSRPRGIVIIVIFKNINVLTASKPRGVSLAMVGRRLMA